jgi:hypothetical protein
MTKAEILRTLDEKHGQVLSKLNDLSDAEMETRPIEGDWTAKDLLAHMTRWENICAGYLDKILGGEPIPQLGSSTNDLNARDVAEDRALSLAQVWRNSDASFLRVKVLVESLEDAMLDLEMRGPWQEIREVMPLSRIIEIDTWGHYLQHLATLKV